MHAHLIDLSEAALARSVQALAALEGPDVRVTTHQATYEEGLLALPRARRTPTLVAFLGSNIGNFDPPGAAAFLGLIRAALRPGDCLLLGADLVKPERDLLLAYDDPLGLTAAFNKNLLLRLNTELRCGLRARSLRASRGVESATRRASRCTWSAWARRTSDRGGAGSPLPLEEGETIWTESSYKFEAGRHPAAGRAGGLRTAAAVDRRASPIRADAVRGGLS